jgi:hypothetical protein
MNLLSDISVLNDDGIMGMPVRARRKFQSECGCFRPQRRFASLATVSHRQEFGAIRALSDTDLSINAGDLGGLTGNPKGVKVFDEQ